MDPLAETKRALEVALARAEKAEDLLERAQHEVKRRHAHAKSSESRVRILEERNVVLEQKVKRLMAAAASAAETARFEKDVLRLEIEAVRKAKAPTPSEALLEMHDRQSHWLGKYKEAKQYITSLEKMLHEVKQELVSLHNAKSPSGRRNNRVVSEVGVQVDMVVGKKSRRHGGRGGNGRNGENGEGGWGGGGGGGGGDGGGERRIVVEGMQSSDPSVRARAKLTARLQARISSQSPPRGAGRRRGRPRGQERGNGRRRGKGQEMAASIARANAAKAQAESTRAVQLWAATNATTNATNRDVNAYS